MNLNIREMLTGKPMKMRYVYRFQGCRVYDRESIAEHTAFVGMYAMFIGRYIQNTTDLDLDMGLLLSRVIVHDMEEVVTGDFPRPYKYSNPKLKEALDEAAPAAFLQVLAGLFTGKGSDAELGDLQHYWIHAKDDSLEGQILAFADFLSALSFIVQEVQAGNKSMNAHNWTLRLALSELRKKLPACLHELLDDTEMLMVEYVP